MTDLGRWHNVGITSVLRRCAACVVVTFLVAVGGVDAASAPNFKTAFEACVKFYKSEDVSAFEALEADAPLKRTCSNCTTLLGRYSAGSLQVLVNLTDQGRYAGIDCRLDRSSATLSKDEQDQVFAWLNSMVADGHIEVLPKEQRLYRGELLRACVLSKPQLHILLDLQPDQRLSFQMFSGESTGVYDKRPIVFCGEK